MTDEQMRAEIARLLAVREAARMLHYDAWQEAFNTTYRQYEEQCQAIYQGLSPAVTLTLMRHNYDGERLRRTPDATLLMLRPIGPAALTRIRRSYPYDPPPADYPIPQEWRDDERAVLAAIEDRRAEKKAEEKRYNAERERFRPLTSLSFSVRVPLNGEPMRFGDAAEIIAAATRSIEEAKPISSPVPRTS